MKSKNVPNKDCPACKKSRVFRKISDRVMICKGCGATLRRNSLNHLIWVGGK